MTALYDLAGQYRQLAERLANLDLDAETVADTIEASGLTDEINAKAQGVLLVAKQAEQYLPHIDAEIARLRALKARHERVAQGLRDYLKRNMEAAGIERIECPLFQISIRTNPAAVEVFDEAQVPKELLRVKYEVDKTAIKAELKAGREVAGCRLVNGTRLEVK
jgi:phage host-nuclease inhibitor protein Gam